MALRIALFQPEIPPNTGNIARLCVAIAAELHIVGPASFDLSEKAARRAGLDYWNQVNLSKHSDWEEFLENSSSDSRIFLVSTKGKLSYTSQRYRENDTFLFGSETSGLPEKILSSVDPSFVIRIPMEDDCRCLNLSNAVAVVAYEALRQIKSW
ncbi:rRNA methyltransferase [Leptospira perolatii]|uniref:Putative tRNA (cytidine(34)-2'-O)-methyltransferase n=1 Tax=Leptospira perolatii TaxID=2023191 RepID=A0A2M9ZSZ9_9LEPT|nr:tRNA (cytidine(34)-2'-O)-methyltransferase [Leptospira perolatii]PJZ68744.1 rRNA methyltransferase [Leptospira perolatii]PJZ75099.1 rRNA methyltransferase [Leptospira perolatii]